MLVNTETTVVTVAIAQTTRRVYLSMAELCSARVLL